MKAASMDLDAHVIPMMPPARAESVAIDDLAELLGAVRDRLRLAAAAALAELPPPHANGPVCTLRTQVLECVGALDQLHFSLGQQVRRLRLLEVEDEFGRLAG